MFVSNKLRLTLIIIRVAILTSKALIKLFIYLQCLSFPLMRENDN